MDRQRSWRDGWGAKRLGDRINNARRVTEDIVVAEAHDAIAFRLKPLCAAVIVPGVVLNIMLRAVEFDDQPRLRAKEVDDVMAYWLLAAKFETV